MVADTIFDIMICRAKFSCWQGWIQEDLNSVIQWTAENNMLLHEGKFQYINHNCGESKLLQELPFTSELYEYITPNGTILSPEDSVRDLGIKVTSSLTWSPHIRNIVQTPTEWPHGF